MFEATGMSEDEWQDLLVYWTMAPRGEIRQDLRIALAAMMPHSKDAARQYVKILELNANHETQEQVEFIRQSSQMSPEEILNAI